MINEAVWRNLRIKDRVDLREAGEYASGTGIRYKDGWPIGCGGPLGLTTEDAVTLGARYELAFWHWKRRCSLTCTRRALALNVYPGDVLSWAYRKGLSMGLDWDLLYLEWRAWLEGGQ